MTDGQLVDEERRPTSWRRRRRWRPAAEDSVAAAARPRRPSTTGGLRAGIDQHDALPAHRERRRRRLEPCMKGGQMLMVNVERAAAADEAGSRRSIAATVCQVAAQLHLMSFSPSVGRGATCSSQELALQKTRFREVVWDVVWERASQSVTGRECPERRVQAYEYKGF